MQIDAKFYGEFVTYGTLCPDSNALKKQALRGWWSGMFQESFFPWAGSWMGDFQGPF